MQRADFLEHDAGRGRGPRKTASDKAIHAGFVLLDPRFSFFWALTINCLQSEAVRRGVKLTVVPVLSVEQQVAELQALLDSGVDAIFVKPVSVDAPALWALVRRATAQGVMVLALDTGVVEPGVAGTIGIDNARGQAMVAEYIFEQLGRSGKVAYFQGDLRMPVGLIRAQSLHQTVRRYPDIEICFEVMLDWQTSASRREKGALHAREALALHPDLDAIISASDEGALGAMDVIGEAGLENRILLAGFDGIPEALLSIFSGRMLVTAWQSPEAIAADAIEALLKSLRGETVSQVYSELHLVTADSVTDAAIDTLQIIPRMVRNLANSSEAQRQLQQTVISAQDKILQTMAAVSRIVNRIREPDEMMIKVVNLVAERFELYCAALYLIDHTAEAAQKPLLKRQVLNSKMAQGHYPVEEHPTLIPAADSLISICLQMRQAQVANRDGGNTDQWLAGCETRAVLPLSVGGTIIGVLEVHSTEAGAFDENTVMVLQTICDQIAIALENARLYAQSSKRAEEQEATSKFLESVIDNIPIVLFLKDAQELRFLRWNKAGAETLGYHAEELIGKCDDDFFPREQADFFTNADRKVLTGGRMIDISEEQIQTKHRGMRLLHTKKIPLFDRHGKPEFLLGISEDITDRKNSEILLENRARELERAYLALQENQEQLVIVEKMASIGRLTAGIAHEMNTPLAAVRSAMSELRELIQEYHDAIGDASVNANDHAEIASDMEKALTLAASSAERAAGFVRGVKIRTRDLSAHQLIRFNTVPVIREAMLLLSHALRQGECTATLQTEGKLLELYGSPPRLAQVVTNLVVNAIEASAGRGGAITLTLKRRTRHLELTVTDQGAGIDPEIAPKIFDPMFTTKPFGQGTGLGLTIVHDIVTDDFKGTIEMATQPGKGTTFTLRLALPGRI